MFKKLIDNAKIYYVVVTTDNINVICWNKYKKNNKYLITY